MACHTRSSTGLPQGQIVYHTLTVPSGSGSSRSGVLAPSFPTSTTSAADHFNPSRDHEIPNPVVHDTNKRTPCYLRPQLTSALGTHRAVCAIMRARGMRASLPEEERAGRWALTVELLGAGARRWVVLERVEHRDVEPSVGQIRHHRVLRSRVRNVRARSTVMRGAVLKWTSVEGSRRVNCPRARWR